MKNRTGQQAGEATSAATDYAALLDLSPLPAVVHDREFKIAASNLLANDVLQYKNLIGRKLADIFPSADSSLPASIDEYVCEDGERRDCEVFLRSLPGGARVIFFNDVTDRKATEKALIAAEEQKFKTLRSEALERLAGGVAHEFNNLLAVILLQTEMMNLSLSPDDAMAERVNEIGGVANDAAAIVRQLLAFGQRQAMNPSPIVINRVIDSCSRELKILLGGDVELKIDLESSLGVAQVDGSQIAQALMYLALNAKDAMPNGGKLVIRTTNIEIETPPVLKTQPIGSYVQIEVADDGVGMDAKTAEHIFEPFFSKKGSKKAPGLGLATVWGIVKQSGGYIWVTSEPGEGTTFKIQFPRIDEVIPKAGKVEEKPAARFEATILLLDDEALVRRLAAEGLRKAGYRVLEASHGAEAVEIAQSFKQAIDLVVTDYSMPSMNGDEAAFRIREIHTDASLLLMSGDPGIFQDTETPDAHFLAKPFSIRDLTQKVEAILDSRPIIEV